MRALLVGLMLFGAFAAFAQAPGPRPAVTTTVPLPTIAEGKICAVTCEPSERFVFETKTDADAFAKAMEPRKCKVASGCVQ